ARTEGRFFENLIRAELLDNPHRALVTAVPDTELEERQRRLELDRLAAIESTLSEADRARIVADALRLKEDQEAKHDLSVLQSLAARDDYLQSFVISGRALDRNAQPFIELMTDLIARLEVEPKRLREIIAEISTRLESSLAGLGFQFAVLRAHSKLSSEGAINDRLQGIGMLHTMRRLAKLGEKDLGDVIARLDEIRTRL